MNVRDNQTLVRAEVVGVAPAAGGYGHELALRVLGNDTADPADDFLRPQAGDELTVFAADLAGVRPGGRIHATLGLAGGPFGQRAVLRAARPVTGP